MQEKHASAKNLPFLYLGLPAGSLEGGSTWRAPAEAGAGAREMERRIGFLCLLPCWWWLEGWFVEWGLGLVVVVVFVVGVVVVVR